MTTPPPQVWPTLRARDARALIDFLVAGLGFVEVVAHTDDAGAVVHAELAWPPGGGVMLGQVRSGPDAAGDPWALAPGSFGGYVVARDAAHVDDIARRAAQAGAGYVGEPTDTDYGSHDVAIRDPEGNRWSVGTYPGADRP